MSNPSVSMKTLPIMGVVFSDGSLIVRVTFQQADQLIHKRLVKPYLHRDRHGSPVEVVRINRNGVMSQDGYLPGVMFEMKSFVTSPEKGKHMSASQFNSLCLLYKELGINPNVTYDERQKRHFTEMRLRQQREEREANPVNVQLNAMTQADRVTTDKRGGVEKDLIYQLSSLEIVLTRIEECVNQGMALSCDMRDPDFGRARRVLKAFDDLGRPRARENREKARRRDVQL